MYEVALKIHDDERCAQLEAFFVRLRNSLSPVVACHTYPPERSVRTARLRTRLQRVSRPRPCPFSNAAGGRSVDTVVVRNRAADRGASPCGISIGNGSTGYSNHARLPSSATR